MTSSVRAPVNDVTKLVIALKMRFLDLLEKDDWLDQIDLMLSGERRRSARLDLRRENGTGGFSSWLEIEQLTAFHGWMNCGEVLGTSTSFLSQFS